LDFSAFLFLYLSRNTRHKVVCKLQCNGFKKKEEKSRKEEEEEVEEEEEKEVGEYNNLQKNIPI